MVSVMERQQDYVLRTVEERGVRHIRLWFSDVLGQLKSAVVNVTGAIVNVNGVPGGGGGPPLPGGPAAQEGESLLSKVGKVFQFLGLAGSMGDMSSGDDRWSPCGLRSVDHLLLRSGSPVA